jgi:hypothetical protein
VGFPLRLIYNILWWLVVVVEAGLAVAVAELVDLEQEL